MVRWLCRVCNVAPMVIRLLSAVVPAHMVERLRVACFLFCLLCSAQRSFAQPCLGSYVFTQNPLPVGGVYQAGQTVNFCFTITFWNTTNANWMHGMVPTFGPGWDISTFVPGPPPPTCGASTGTWGFYPICSGTAGTAIGPVGPGWFFDLNNDGIPGNNFGDFCNGAVNWQFCWDITVASSVSCTCPLTSVPSRAPANAPTIAITPKAPGWPTRGMASPKPHRRLRS